MTISKNIALATVAVAIIASPAPASVAVKWLTCQLHDSTKNTVLRLNGPFAMGGTVDVDRQYNNFLEAAKIQGKIDETSKTEGACILSNSEDEALSGVSGFIKHFKAQGARENTVGMAPH